MDKVVSKEWCEKNILLTKEEEYELGWNQCDVTYPCSFPTVTFYLPCTSGLIDLADNIRKQKTGYPPLSASETGWYNFYVEINDCPKAHIDSGIMFTVNDSTAKDDYETYVIDLNETEQAVLYAHLSEMAKAVYGKDAEELLAEARAYYNFGGMLMLDARVFLPNCNADGSDVERILDRNGIDYDWDSGGRLMVGSEMLNTVLELFGNCDIEAEAI